MGDFSPIMAFINGIGSIISGVLGWILDAIFKVIWGCLYVLYDGLLTTMEGVLSMLDVSTLTSALTSSWTGVPAVLLWIVSQAGLASAVAIIGYAYGIRMLLNLIPGVFTRV